MARRKREWAEILVDELENSIREQKLKELPPEIQEEYKAAKAIASGLTNKSHNKKFDKFEKQLGALTKKEKETLLLLLAEKQRRQELAKCKEDCLYFIINYVKIEDRDAAVNKEKTKEDSRANDLIELLKELELSDDKEEEGVAVPFKLWEGQQQALKTMLDNRLTIYLKSRQLGLTWLALAYAAWRMLFYPGYQVVALSKKETPDAKELIRRMKFLFKHLPGFMVQQKKFASSDWSGPVWDSAVLSLTVQHPNNEPSFLISMASTEDAGRSFTANLVILDEWAFQEYAEEIYTSAFPIINRPTGGQVIGISTAKRNTFFEKMWKEAIENKNGFVPVFLPWQTDPRRTEEWYERTKQSLPNSYFSEYPATPEEAFSAGEGIAFPEFSYDIHVCKDFIPPKHWRRWMSADNGYTDPFAWYWFAVSEDGQIFVYREFTRSHDAPRLTYSEQARQVVELSTYVDIIGGFEFETREKIDFISIGKDAWNTHHRDEKGKTLIDYYHEGGLYGFVPAITDRRLRKAVVHEYLRPYLDENTGKMTAKLQICKSCKKLIETLPQLVLDERDPEKVAESPIDHWYDALGYGLIAYHVGATKPLPEDAPLIRRHKERMARRSKKVWRRLA